MAFLWSVLQTKYNSNLQLALSVQFFSTIQFFKQRNFQYKKQILFYLNKLRKMFPFDEYYRPLMPYQGQTHHYYQNPTYQHCFPSFPGHDHFYQPYYFHRNANYNEMTHSNFTQDENSMNYRPFLSRKFMFRDKLLHQMNDSSSTKNDMILAEPLIDKKTKIIHKRKDKSDKDKIQGNKKQKNSKSDSKNNESEYLFEEENNKKLNEQQHLYLKYRRKNTQSNIVNRIYSFLTSQFKNKKQFPKFGLTEQQRQTYLKYLLIIVDAWKGPVKRQLLFSMLNVTESLPGYKLIEKMYEEEKVLSIQKFSRLNRILIQLYLSKIAVVSIITSKKMRRAVWKQHLQKIRELNEYFYKIQEKEL